MQSGQRHIRHRFVNPMGLVLLVLSVAVVLGVISLVLLVLSPESVGLLKEETPGDDVYQFETLDVEGRYIQLHLADGLMVPAYRSGEVSGVVLFSRGEYVITFSEPQATEFAATFGTTSIRDSLVAMYVPGSYQDFERLREAARATPADVDIGQEAQALLNDVRRDPRFVRVLGVFRLLVPVQRSRILYLYGETFGQVRYEEGPQVSVTFVALDGRKFSFTDPRLVAPGLTPPATGASGSPLGLVIFSASVVLLLLLVFILTLDMDPPALVHPPEGPGTDREAYPIRQAGAVAVILLADLGFRAFSLQRGWPAESLVWLHGAMAAGLAAIAWRQGALARLGITTHHLARGVVIAVILAGFTLVAASLAYPAGLKPASAGRVVAGFVWSVGVFGLSREIVFRGFIQASLQRRWGLVPGLLVTAWLGGLLYFLPRAALYPGMAGDFAVHGLLLVPYTGLLAGYLFQRTGNVFASATLQGLLDFLPRILRF